MDAERRNKLETGGRIHAFCLAHPDDNPGYNDAVRHVGDLLERGSTLSAQQRSGRVAVEASTERRNVILKEVRARLRHARTVAEAADREEPGLAAKFQLPSGNTSREAMLTVARTVAAEAEARKELLLRYGMAPSLAEDLNRALAEYAEAAGDAHAGRRAHVGARAELERVTAEIMETARLLDGIIRFRYRDNAEVLAAWASARDVAWPGRNEPPIVPEAGGGEVSPTV